jgi:hypothetical protein
MRIVAGRHRGRVINAPQGNDIRPTSGPGARIRVQHSGTQGLGSRRTLRGDGRANPRRVLRHRRARPRSAEPRRRACDVHGQEPCGPRTLPTESRRAGRTVGGRCFAGRLPETGTPTGILRACIAGPSLQGGARRTGPFKRSAMPDGSHQAQSAWSKQKPSGFRIFRMISKNSIHESMVPREFTSCDTRNLRPDRRTVYSVSAYFCFHSSNCAPIHAALWIRHVISSRISCPKSRRAKTVGPRSRSASSCWLRLCPVRYSRHASAFHSRNRQTMTACGGRTDGSPFFVPEMDISI